MENDYSSFGAMSEISRRAFVGSLIASAVVVGVPLPLKRVDRTLDYPRHMVGSCPCPCGCKQEILVLYGVEFKQFGLMFHYDRPCKGHEVWECPPYSCGGA